MLETLKLTGVSVSGSREKKSPEISGSGLLDWASTAGLRISSIFWIGKARSGRTLRDASGRFLSKRARERESERARERVREMRAARERESDRERDFTVK